MQDEDAAPFLDEQTNTYIYDDLRGDDVEFKPVKIREIFTLPETSPIGECVSIPVPCLPVCSPPPCPPLPCPPKPCPSLPVICQSEIFEEVLATEDLPAFVIILATGKRADSSDATHQGRVIGITVEPVPSGQTGRFISEGTVENPEWSWTPGDRLYLNGMSISAILPSIGFLQPVAIAETPTTIFFDLGIPILL